MKVVQEIAIFISVKGIPPVCALFHRKIRLCRSLFLFEKEPAYLRQRGCPFCHLLKALLLILVEKMMDADKIKGITLLMVRGICSMVTVRPFVVVNDDTGD